MWSLTTIFRHRLCFVDAKNLAVTIEKSHAYDAVKFQNSSVKSSRAAYGLRKYGTENQKKNVTVSQASTQGEVSTTFETIKETSKTAWYSTVVLAGFGITAVVLFTLFSELFSSSSPHSIYSESLKRCINDEKVVFTLGAPIKAYGEENSRRRRRHVSHLIYEKDGVNYIRMKFYVQGSRSRGTVHLEKKENDKGKYEYRYLFVQMDDYPYNTIILEDNRNKATLTPLPPLQDTPELL